MDEQKLVTSAGGELKPPLNEHLQLVVKTGLELKLEEFERRLAALEAPKSALLLASPNGQYTVQILATDDGAGIWIANPDPRGSWRPCVAMYNGWFHGAVVGLWGNKDPINLVNDTSMVAGLCANTHTGEGTLQLTGHGLVHQYTAQQLAR